MGEHVVGDEQVRRTVLPDELPGERLREELADGRDAEGDRVGGDIGGRLDADGADAARDDVSEQVAVVARDFDDERLRTELEPLDRSVDVAPGVLDPAVGVGREIGVIGEDLACLQVGRQLDEQADIAHADVERIEPLHRVETFERQEILAWR